MFVMNSYLYHFKKLLFEKYKSDLVISKEFILKLM